MSNVKTLVIDRKNTKSLSDLANFVGKTAMPHKHRINFWNAYKTATSDNVVSNKPKRATDLLGVVMAVSARTRRIVSPKTTIELDVFTPTGGRAVQLIMGKYS